jgi:hypothetical protein
LNFAICASIGSRLTDESIARIFEKAKIIFSE